MKVRFDNANLHSLHPLRRIAIRPCQIKDGPAPGLDWAGRWRQRTLSAGPVPDRYFQM